MSPPESASEAVPGKPENSPKSADHDASTRIFRSARTLIAQKGPVATTIRDICVASNANVAAVHYYFGSKDALVRAALLSILEPVNIDRRERLAAARRRFTPAPIPVPDILDAMLRPIVAAERGADGGRLIIRTQSHLRAVPGSDYAQFMAHQMDVYAQLFIDALAETLPRFSRAELIWRYEFIRGLTMHLLANCDPLSHKFQTLAGTDPMIDLEDDELVLRELMGTALQGLAAPAAWSDLDVGRVAQP
ncbi:TetR/AcrR family transcriptional regulator [Achromobacter aloeverae]|uniref:TetR family transcriptional regulator n=1 Tax=Achromobacter aloeverae TaxID=1750518 RepID=A0A4Q1HHY0_9BURK|nr:TetR/AcrR family transcriptional regulator [Achromobacter aloeverae]RXN86975.1 TetR family transcriptional regulator [Achromobacter aloeverae]